MADMNKIAKHMVRSGADVETFADPGSTASWWAGLVTEILDLSPVSESRIAELVISYITGEE